MQHLFWILLSSIQIWLWPLEIIGEALHHQHSQYIGTATWEGSLEGKAYSEFNHHLAGLFVILIGFSELSYTRTSQALNWARHLLPVGMLAAGSYLMVWSDHDAWPLGPRSFSQTFFGDDWEAIQHKLYATLLLAIGLIELLRREGRIKQFVWPLVLPTFAILGGLLLFLHSHSVHPAAHKIAVHHAVMGISAIAAGICKIIGGAADGPRFGWQLAWASLVLLIGIQLLCYSE